MGYALEVDMIRLAHDKDMLTTPYVFSPRMPRRWRGRGRHYRLSSGPHDGGAIGAGTALRLEQCPALVDQWPKRRCACDAISSYLFMAARSPSRQTPSSY